MHKGAEPFNNELNKKIVLQFLNASNLLKVFEFGKEDR
jgi:hypothetical protein